MTEEKFTVTVQLPKKVYTMIQKIASIRGYKSVEESIVTRIISSLSADCGVLMEEVTDRDLVGLLGLDDVFWEYLGDSRFNPAKSK